MIKRNPLISFLIINYNNTNLLSRSINSCLKQTYKNFEILVFDDKSNISIKLIKDKYKYFKKIKFYENKKKKIMIPAFDASNAYEFLIKRSRGKIISFLDSDDYIHRDKAKYINDTFNKFKNIAYIQNLTLNKNLPEENHAQNSLISFWPYLAPESCISFKKSFFLDFQKNTRKYNRLYTNLWLGFRLGVYSYYKKKNFYQLNKKLTFYENFGESLKYKKFNHNWWQRRKVSFKYAYKISKNKKLLLNFDYLITLIVAFLMKFIK